MPVDSEVVLNITCDNAACPGNELDAASRDGWTFITAEVYGVTTSAQYVYCCSACAGTINGKLDAQRESAPYPMGIGASAPA